MCIAAFVDMFLHELAPMFVAHVGAAHEMGPEQLAYLKEVRARACVHQCMCVWRGRPSTRVAVDAGVQLRRGEADARAD